MIRSMFIILLVRLFSNIQLIRYQWMKLPVLQIMLDIVRSQLGAV